MYITNLGTFDQVADWYAKTKPVLSKKHTLAQDVRPIGKRSRKWERIIKVDDRTYALSCGGNVDPVFHWGYTDKVNAFPLTPKEIANLSPIVWRKAKDGTETVTVRNGAGSWAHNAVYSFISRALPMGLIFRNGRHGQQAIYNRANSTRYYLPKTRTVPRHHYESIKERALRQPQSRWEAYRLKEICVGPDKLELTFKRVGDGKFELVGEAPKEMIDRKRVDLMGKKKFKPHLDELYAWVNTMYPMMHKQLGWNLRMEVEQQVNDLAVQHKFEGYRRSYSDLLSNCEADLMRKVLLDKEHLLRYGLGMAAMFAFHEGYINAEHGEESRYCRASYTRWANRMFGFNKIVKEEK